MFYMEYVIPETEMFNFIQEGVGDPESAELKSKIIDPVISILSEVKNRKKYIQYGNEFLEANAEMLASEYPTKAVVFPRKYVDDVLELFGFSVASLKETILPILRTIQNRDKANFQKIIATPSNVIHTIVLFYSDTILNRELRDSARQQMGLTMYNTAFKKYFSTAYDKNIMAYTYMNLDRSWGLVKAEDIVTWIGNTVDVSYGFFKTKLTVNMSPAVLASFLGRLLSSFNQNMQQIANRYYINLNSEDVASIGDDVKAGDEYIVSDSFTQLRNNIMRNIKNGDSLYKNKNNLYSGVARLKNVKVETLYNFAQRIDHSDISKIVDNILYVFLVKEGNSIDDINTTKYISRITNMPTAVDRAITGKPIILPMSKKYKEDSIIIKAYVCLIATYILNRINDIK